MGDSTGITHSYVNFSDALEICKGKNATVFEPNSREEADTIYNFVKQKRSGSQNFVWINYRDIQDQAPFVGVNNSVFLSSSYMCSLSTMAPIPIEWWSNKYNRGGVDDMPCTVKQSLVCEKDASERNLKEYIKSL